MPKSQLLELYAHGLGVIEDARLEFGAGFNVLTGETGAGKTLLLGALDLCLGGDGSVTRAAIASDMRAAAVFDLQWRTRNRADAGVRCLGTPAQRRRRRLEQRRGAARLRRRTHRHPRPTRLVDVATVAARCCASIDAKGNVSIAGR